MITGAFAVIGNIIINSANRKKISLEDAKKEQKIADRLDAIETKLDIHNGYAQKFGDIQIDIAVIKNEIKNLKE